LQLDLQKSTPPKKPDSHLQNLDLSSGSKGSGVVGNLHLPPLDLLKVESHCSNLCGRVTLWQTLQSPSQVGKAHVQDVKSGQPSLQIQQLKIDFSSISTGKHDKTPSRLDTRKVLEISKSTATIEAQFACGCTNSQK